MADYSSRFVQEYEVRNFFTPPLEYDDISKAEILLKIESVENYIIQAYFDGSSPGSTAKTPALLLVMAKIIRSNPTLIKKYGDIESFEIGDYKVKFMGTGKGKHVTAYETSKSWEEMAYDMLEILALKSWDALVLKAND